MSITERFPWLYRLVIIETFVELLVIFTPTVAFRVSNPGWKLQTVDMIIHSFELDLHVVTAVLLYLLLALQFVLAAGRADRLHRLLGRVLCALFVPMAAAAVAVVIVNPLPWLFYFSAAALYLLFAQIAMLAWGVRAIRAKQIDLHVDALFMFLVLFGALATLRIPIIVSFLATGQSIPSTILVLGGWTLLLVKSLVPVLVVRGLCEHRFALLVLVGGLAAFGVWGAFIGPGEILGPGSG